MRNMKDLFVKLRQILNEGDSAVMVTIIAGSGSTPRGAGARMLVNRDGRVCGTIGGGAVEYRSTSLARQALENGKSILKAFTLRRNEVEDLGMICGGDVKVFFQLITPTALDLIEQIISCFDCNKDAWLITDITDEADWSMGLYTQQKGLSGINIPEEALSGLLHRETEQYEFENRLYYSELLVQAGKVIVFGGGHVAQELVPVLHRVGFRCTVYEDRQEFASRELFPDAEQVILGDFSRIRDNVEILDVDYVVIMTRGHAWDYTVEEQVLRGETAYTGVIGSRHKIAATRAKLLEAGIPEEKINRVRTPIGLPIKAKTPAEIAVSIAAEMIQVRAER